MNDNLKRPEPLKAVAQSFGPSYDLFFRAAHDGRLKTVRFGNRLYVPSDEIARIGREGLKTKPRGKSVRRTSANLVEA